ncbi:hypothetical protein [Streptococcus cristatus]|uniref:LXG domain-containing protein n=1 Tax=Streptococcus cristatus TaxID=45634 RepID=A0A139N694_STRCR|nr:hypothetical protein [Streptococcus cristatus]KXT71337.1 hypothetical protein SCRDD08_00117 [Streptococcus cristatus]
MSDIIKVHDLPAINRYSSAVQEFSKNVDEASKQTMREFNDKAGKSGGEEDTGEAINAFFERLNTLQTQVFHNFPTTITHFSTALSYFENSATGAGFQKKAWTQQSGNDTVYQKLNGIGSEQYEEVEEKANKLQTLLDDATNKLGIASEDLTSIKVTAGDQLSEAAAARRKTHNALQEAHDTLAQRVTEVEAELQILLTQINSARAVCSIPATSILEGIKNGSFRKSKIGYFDSLQTEADGRALGAILSKQPEEMLKEKPETLSEGLYLIGAQQMMEWIQTDDAATLNRLLDAMGKRDFSANAPFLKGFQQAGLKMGDTTTEAMDKEYQKNGNLNSEQMSKYSAYVDLSDKFVGLMESLYMLEIGTVRTTKGSLHKNSRLYTTDTTTALSITNLDKNSATIGLNADIIKRKMTTESNAYGMTYPVGDHTSKERKNYVTQIFSTYDGADSWDKQTRLGELAESRKKAREDLAVSLAKGVGYSALTVFAPQVVPLVMAIDGLATNDNAKFADQFGSFVDKDMTVGGKTLKGGFTGTGSYVFGVSLPIESLENYMAYKNQLNVIQNEEDKIRLQFIDKFLDKGGAGLGQELSDGKIVNVSSLMRHDFKSTLILKEMDNQGIVPYVDYARTAEGFELTDTGSTRQIIKDTINKINGNENGLHISSKVQSYLLGDKNSSLSLTDMSNRQITEFQTVLERLPINAPNYGATGTEEYKHYIDSRYK